MSTDKFTLEEYILSIKFSIAILFFCFTIGCHENGDGPPPGKDCDPASVISCESSADRWQLLGLDGESVVAIETDPCDPRILYVGTQFDFSAGRPAKLFNSTDCGKTWDTLFVSNNTGGVRTIWVNPKERNILFSLPYSILKSIDGGKHWQESANGIYLDFDTRVQCLAVDPKDINVMYAGTGGFFGGYLYKSTNSGLNWTRVLPDSLGDGVSSIAIDPENSKNLYVGTAGSGIIIKSTDAGLSWNYSGMGETGSIIHDIFIDADHNSNIYAGVNIFGLYKSEDFGVSWTKWNQGLPSSFSIVKIKKNYLKNTMYVIGTYGDNGWIYEFSNVQNQWIKIGIDSLRQSYYYSDLKLSSDNKTLYFGGKGIYTKAAQ